MTLLLAVNAAWVVGVIVPDCCADLTARCAALVAGGAVGYALFGAGDRSGTALVAAIVASQVCGVAAGVLVERGPAAVRRFVRRSS